MRNSTIGDQMLEAENKKQLDFVANIVEMYPPVIVDEQAHTKKLQ